jgi:transcriptional regulator with XRE-family HTH domain
MLIVRRREGLGTALVREGAGLADSWRGGDVDEIALLTRIALADQQMEGWSMDMNIDSRLVRREREKRAWSQELLATASGLGLRTIQRVETTGSGSYETAKAIAAVLELQVSDLRVVTDKDRPAVSLKRRWYGAGAAATALSVSAFIAGEVFAGQLMLDVGMTMNDQQLPVRQLITDEGKNAEVRVDGQIRLVIQPSINRDGNIEIATEVHEFDGTKYSLVSRPKLTTSDNKEAELRLSTSQGGSIQISIRPHKI